MSAQQELALTWSGKWHVVNPGHPDARRYAVSRCGTYVYRNDDPQYPNHLTQIKQGTKKSSGMCKRCNRIVGVKTVTIELPAPNCSEGDLDNGESAAWIDLTFGVEHVAVVGDEVRLTADADLYSPAEAKALAAALLAAADAAEAVMS